MKLSKALKVKNRLVGEIKTISDEICEHNCYTDENMYTLNTHEHLKLLMDKINNLVQHKIAIQMATRDILPKLIEMTELKALISMIKTIPTKEGKSHLGYGQHLVTTDWKSQLNKENVKILIKELQERVEALQDEIDEYNATTTI